MTCKVLFDPARVHVCAKPETGTYSLGTIIQCDECKKMWKLNSEQRGGNEWVGYIGPIPNQDDGKLPLINLLDR